VIRTMVARLTSALLVALALSVADASAQTIAYRQNNLASDVTTQGFAIHIDPFLRNPWGITFEPGIAFFIANANNGRVIARDASGSPVGPAGFIVPSPTGSTAFPVAVVADPDSFFSEGNLTSSVIVATEDGRIYFWGRNPDGSFLPDATLAVDHAQLGAVYTGMAILKPDCCAPFLGVANFHSGRVETYSTSFVQLGSFVDPNLPAGYAPFGMQVVGKQLFVTSALQDPAKHDPVSGAGNGIVSVFDLEGHFVRRFATAGSLNAPWGITQASANFGPLSGQILVGNLGDGTIAAYDPDSGNFAGQIKDGDGNVLVNQGLHGMTFGFAGFGDPDTLYFTANIRNNAQDGLFGAISTGFVSTTRVSIPATSSDAPVAVSVRVSAGPSNRGTPTGRVTIQDSGVVLGNPELINGEATFDVGLTGTGTHEVEVQYSGDENFLPSTSQAQVQVTGLSDSLVLAAPQSAAPGSTVTLTATINSTQGVPTGQIEFHDGGTSLGTAPLDDTGVAALRTNTLSAGTHSLTANYSGDAKFAASTSPSVNLTITSPDFSFGANPMSAVVTAGQSTQFTLTVAPAAGFASNVTFTCSQITGITCAFNPPTVTPANAAASTILTVTTSSGVPRYGLLIFPLIGPAFLFGAAALFGSSLRKGGKMGSFRAALLASTAAVAFFSLSLVLGGCGGYGSSTQTNRGTASITVLARSGATSHATTVNVTVH
jgi:uncharacterized protein (TIGR03118 family)